MKKEAIIYLTIVLTLIAGVFMFMPASAREEQNNKEGKKEGLSPPFSKGGRGGLSDAEESVQAIMKALEDRERELAIREDALRKEEDRLNMLKSAIELSLKEYSAMRERLQKELNINNSKDSQSQQSIVHVVKMYESMSPEEAAQRIGKIDSVMAVELLLKIKSKKAGKILEAMPADKAALLTEKIAAKKGDK